MKDVQFNELFSAIDAPIKRRRTETRYTVTVPLEGLRIHGTMPDFDMSIGLTPIEHAGVAGVFNLTLRDSGGNALRSIRYVTRNRTLAWSSHDRRMARVEKEDRFSVDLLHSGRDGKPKIGKVYIVVTRIKK